ncbi:MAG: hypothetical protein J0I79_28180, partial [Mesorhizobium sp.]|uniref:hypothetical protein n=1 Tax=Mesorhizobium sp. TaxID=1871066 RepID=UPI001AD44C0B
MFHRNVLKIFRAKLAAGPWHPLWSVRTKLPDTPNRAFRGLFGANIGETKALDDANLHQSLHEPLWLRMG